MLKHLIRVVLGLTIATLALGPARPAAAAVPTGFADALVASVGSPTALVFTPDGRLLITTQPGRLRVYQAGSLLSTPAVDFTTQWPGGSRICSGGERGLLGVAVDPAFSTNNYIYLFYTYRRPTASPCATNNPANEPVNRVSRFTMSGNTVLTTTETVLVDNMPSPNGNHNAGDLAFGKDGYLYISIGDGGCDYAGDSGCAGSNDAARDQHVLTGKILRLTSTGGIPPDNPFQGAGTARCNVTGSTTPGNKCQETFAWGLRNPFRFAFDPNAAGTRFYVNDVGQGAWEEIDLGQAGADYGWNCREGAHTNSTSGKCNPTPPGMVDPIYEYGHGTGCASITGGAFVPGSIGWPAAYDGKYLFADYVCGKIFRLDPAGGGGYTAVDFATGLGSSSAVHMTFGPYLTTQALYYTTYAGGGQVRRIAYTLAPTAVIAANPIYGPLDLNVTFDAAGSSDPDGDALVYDWDFGDGAQLPNGPISTTHTYTVAGVYTATVVADDGRGGLSAPASVRIFAGNTPPTPAMTLPAPGATFSVGQTVSLQGSATDAQDDGDGDPLTYPTLSWNVLIRHVDQANPGNAHTHPVFSGGGAAAAFSAPGPEDFGATALSYLEVQLTATDSWGLAATITRTLQPNRVNVTFATTPAGLNLGLNGSTITTTQTFVSWQNYVFNVSAPVPQYSSGQWWVFDHWSDGGAAAHTISTPASAITYTATFKPGFVFWLPLVGK
jgi:glucose/arabinose dehydrogenase